MNNRPTMTCKRARLHIALVVGGDLDESDEAALNAHLAVCPPCQRQRQSMEANLRPLQERDDESPFTLHDSLWPSLTQRLPDHNALMRARYNGWWAASAVLIACMAIALFWQNQTQVYRDWEADSVSLPSYSPRDKVKEPDYGLLNQSLGSQQIKPSPDQDSKDERWFRKPDFPFNVQFINERYSTNVLFRSE